MEVLGGMIHCQFVSPEEIEGIIDNFQSTLRPEDGGQLVTRHGAVLGLCSVVTAFPHTVPPLVPPLLVYLGRFLHDKQPIPGPNPSHLSLSILTALFCSSHHQEECPELEENSPGQLESAQGGLY